MIMNALTPFVQALLTSFRDQDAEQLDLRDIVQLWEQENPGVSVAGMFDALESMRELDLIENDPTYVCVSVQGQNIASE